MKIIVITGATSGIGYATAKEIAGKGHHVILACRNGEKGLAVKNELTSLYPEGQIDLEIVDLADLASIKLFAENMNEKYDTIDVLINNAGVFSDTRKRTKDGYELTIGTNFVGQVLITQLLLPLLKKSVNGRIVNISSEAGLYGRLKVTDRLFTKSSKGFIAYSKSKLAQLLYTIDLAEVLKEESIVVNAVHPGHVATNIWQGETLLMKIVGPINMRKYLSPEAAAHIGVEVALSDQYAKTTGKLIEVSGEMTFNKRCLDLQLRKDLMAMTFRELGL